MGLEDASVLHLMVELLHGGNGGVPQLAALEPIDVELIVAALRQRSGLDLGRDFDAWYRWFMQGCREATEFDRQSLALMKKMLDERRYFVERLSKKRGKPQ